MIDLTTRINATIPYFFLGPIVLFAKKGTPLAHPFVQWHAKRSSYIILLGVISYTIFLFLEPLLNIAIFGFVLSKICMMLIIAGMILFLLMGAYRAYQWQEAGDFSKEKIGKQVTFKVRNLSEEERIRVITSTLPFMGIILAVYFPMNEILLNRKIANYFTFFLIISLILFGPNNSITFFISGLYIIWCVTVAVMLLMDGKMLHSKIFESLPTYRELEAHIHTGIFMIKEFFRIAFGAKKTWTYWVKYREVLSRISTPLPNNTPFWTHRSIIALPVLNLITLPSFFRPSMAPYRLVIAEWMVITILFILFFVFFWKASVWLYLLLFPIITLIAESRHNLHIRAPISSIAVDILIWIYRMSKTVHHLHHTKHGERYTYENQDASSQAWESSSSSEKTTPKKST